MEIFDFLSFVLNENLSTNFYSELKNWITGGAGRNRERYLKKEVPISIFLYLKKLGYLKRGRIYRTIIVKKYVLKISQDSEYIDLYEFLCDNWGKNMELLGFNGPRWEMMQIYMKREREVIARLDPNFKIESIHNFETGERNVNPPNINSIRRDINSYDGGKYISFTNNIFSAEYFNKNIYDQEVYDHYHYNQNRLPKEERDSFEDQHNMFYKWEKNQVENNKKIDKILKIEFPPKY